MEDMAARYAHRSVRSVFLYTREAHPGEDYRHHTSMEDKRHHARAFQAEFGIKRQILLDDLEGSVHGAYGMLPNMTWIIGSGGVIHYKAAWTDSVDIEDALRSPALLTRISIRPNSETVASMSFLASFLRRSPRMRDEWRSSRGKRRCSQR